MGLGSDGSLSDRAAWLRRASRLSRPFCVRPNRNAAAGIEMLADWLSETAGALDPKLNGSSSCFC